VQPPPRDFGCVRFSESTGLKSCDDRVLLQDAFSALNDVLLGRRKMLFKHCAVLNERIAA
jgi:hypothetical protein